MKQLFWTGINIIKLAYIVAYTFTSWYTCQHVNSDYWTLFFSTSITDPNWYKSLHELQMHFTNQASSTLSSEYGYFCFQKKPRWRQTKFQTRDFKMVVHKRKGDIRVATSNYFIQSVLKRILRNHVVMSVSMCVSVFVFLCMYYWPAVCLSCCKQNHKCKSPQVMWIQCREWTLSMIIHSAP